MKYQNERGGRIVLQDIKVRVKFDTIAILERARAFQLGVTLH